jgi:hypothetical protein
MTATIDLAHEAGLGEGVELEIEATGSKRTEPCRFDRLLWSPSGPRA